MPDVTPSARIPSYRRHRPSGQAVVTLNGRDVYLGKWNTKASRTEYDRLVAEWIASGRRFTSRTAAADRTVAEVALIDPNRETLISFNEATALLPRRRGGKKPHVSTLYRWSTSGCKGVILESLQCGGTRVTSRQALARFFDALTYGDEMPRRSPSRRRREAEAADLELQRQGV